MGNISYLYFEDNNWTNNWKLAKNGLQMVNGRISSKNIVDSVKLIKSEENIVYHCLVNARVDTNNWQYLPELYQWVEQHWQQIRSYQLES